jgi:replication fork protection complex subunit Tof1/Swi1
MFKNNRLRLLMDLIGFQRVEDADDTLGASWIVSPLATSIDLTLSLSKIENAERADDVLAEYADHKPADSYLRRKAKASTSSAAEVRRQVADDALSSESDDGGSIDEALFYPAGGPTARKSDHDKPVKKRRLHQRKVVDDEDEEANNARAKARRKKELEKRRKIKSDLYVRASDDETDNERDDEFLKLEAKRRTAAAGMVTATANLPAITIGKKRKGDAVVEERKKKRRSSENESASDSDLGSSINDSDSELLSVSDESEVEIPKKRRQKTVFGDGDSDAASESGAESNKENHLGVGKDVQMKDLEEDVVMKSSAPVRRNVRAGFIIDDSDSE